MDTKAKKMLPVINVPEGLIVKEPIPGIKIFSNFAAYLGIDENTVISDLDDTLPSVDKHTRISPGLAQWVRGDNVDLKYRGNELKRRKIWAQDGPVDQKVRIYSYTGFTYPVAQATSDWNNIEILKKASIKMNAFMREIGGASMNHLIVTAYEDESHNIGFHYDKPRSILPGSYIAILKLGPCSRRFAIRKRANSEEDQAKMPLLFDEVVPAGSLILMTLEANLATQHAVPATSDEVGLSGSIVWRNVNQVLTRMQLDKKINATEGARLKREFEKINKRQKVNA